MLPDTGEDSISKLKDTGGKKTKLKTEKRLKEMKRPLVNSGIKWRYLICI